MDKKLLIGAFTLLLFEILFLLGDMNLLPISWFNFNKSKNNFEIIGVVSDIKQNVRKKSQDSVMWEDTNSSEPVHAYDSILTLSKSAAKIELQGDIKIQLHENTLIVMEPNEDDGNNEFRLKFSRGHLFSKNNNTFKFGTDSWSIQAQKGSDLSLRRNPEGQLEMEVLKGIVELENKINLQKIKASQIRLTLSNENIMSRSTISEQLDWTFNKDIRIYTHQQSVPFTLSWKGAAENIEAIQPSGEKTLITTNKDEKSKAIRLQNGTYYFSLIKDKIVSKKLAIHVWPAERIQYFSPLPRTRLGRNELKTFSWSPLQQAKKYFIEISDDKLFSHTLNLIPTDKNITRTQFHEEGDFYWRVLGVDDEGYLIPPQYSYPIHSVGDPLAAPILDAPKLRAPASKKSPKQKQKQRTKTKNKVNFKGALLKLLDVLFPKAYAEQRQGNLVFRWAPVSEADFYIIEISSQPDFEQPEVIQQVKKSEFVWSKFNKKVYYWRVAAGQYSGRKGLFSEPAKLDLKNIKKAGEVEPGVEYIKNEYVPPPIMTPIEPPPLTPSDEIIAIEPPTPPKPIILTEEDSNWETETWLLFPYYYYTQDTSSELSTSLTGFTLPFLGVRFNGPLRQYGSLIFQIEWGQTTWEPKSASTLPFQSEEKLTWFPAMLHYRPQGSFHSFGATLNYLPAVEKSGLEEVDIKKVRIWNLSYEYTKPWAPLIKSRHILRLGALDDDIQNFSTINTIQYQFKNKLYIGGQLDIDFIQGDLIDRATNTRVGLTLGSEW